ncbi:MAG: hypothetical protein HY273_14070 [Gammaproteobacteria bacterium]|nr:hypothetical protein [Gammaproteobacteria bacterium]
MVDARATTDQLEGRCTEAGRRCFATGNIAGLFVNPHPVSGSIANLAVLTALVSPGDRMVSFGRDSIGHFSLGGKGSLASRLYEVWPLDPERHDVQVDFLKLWRSQKLAPSERPKLIAVGPSSYPRMISWASLRELADSFSPRARLLADISHIAGPIAAGLLESPCAYVDVVTFTTYKSLCGPQGAAILTWDPDLQQQIDRALIPGLQDRAYINSLGELATALEFATTPEFCGIQRTAITLARILADTLKANGVKLAFGGTDTHIVVVDLLGAGGNASTVATALESIGVLSDPIMLPGDVIGEPLGLRFGTIALAQT